MEGVLARLLLPDSSEIAAATTDLRTAFKQPGAIAELCGVLSTSQQPQIRQYGAVLLRYLIILHNIGTFVKLSLSLPWVSQHQRLSSLKNLSTSGALHPW